jgi:hypothetical protein
MRAADEQMLRDDLPAAGKRLLSYIVEHIKAGRIKPGKPQTYLGYKECCVDLGIASADAEIPWGRLLQQHGLTDLAEWTIRNGMPAISGLVVNQSGDRKYFPGGDFFNAFRRPDLDFVWWEGQARKAVATDWTPYL